jgi:hypothetical protein
MITNIIVYNRPSLNVEYDYVGIIDGLSDEERHDFAITQDLTTILSTAGVQPVVVRVGKRLELLSALEWFWKQALDGKKFMLHFVAHGNDEGIAAATEFCDWATLRPYLQKIHSATGETLLLNMSTCKGLHGIKITGTSGEHPFFGLIGAKSDLKVDDALAANRKVYKKWLAGMPVQLIVPETNTELGKELLFNISSEGYRALSIQDG